MVFYRTHSRMDAEDLTQDVMLKAYRHIARLKSPEVFRSWLYRIAVNRVKDYYRRKKFKSLFGFVFMDQEGFHEPMKWRWRRRWTAHVEKGFLEADRPDAVPPVHR